MVFDDGTVTLVGMMHQVKAWLITQLSFKILLLNFLTIREKKWEMSIFICDDLMQIVMFELWLLDARCPEHFHVIAIFRGVQLIKYILEGWKREWLCPWTRQDDYDDGFKYNVKIVILVWFFSSFCLYRTSSIRYFCFLGLGREIKSCNVMQAVQYLEKSSCRGMRKLDGYMLLKWHIFYVCREKCTHRVNLYVHPTAQLVLLNHLVLALLSNSGHCKY